MLGRRSDADFSAEIESHIELETDRLIAQGIPPEQARQRARRAFGNPTLAKERFHERGLGLVRSQIRQDLRYAVRSLRRRPGFAVVAVVCLAIGISVNTATFSLINALIFTDFPGVKAQRELATVLLGRDAEGQRRSPGGATLPDWRELETGLPAFSGMAAFGSASVSTRTTADPEVVRADFVSPGFFDLLGTHPAAGRLFSTGDAADPRRVVLSWRYWDRVFQRSPDVVGRSVTVGTRVFSVMGVAPRGFVGLYPVQVLDVDVSPPALFLPLAAAALVRTGPPETDLPGLLTDDWLSVVGRLRPGATSDQAQAQAAIIADRLAARYPAERSGTFAQVRVGGGAPADPGATAAAILFVMVVPVIILLVACANLANQLLARAEERSGEIAVRLSLGASRARVVRQLLVEAGALALAASALGMLLARWIIGLLGGVLPLPFGVPLDRRVLFFSLVLAVGTALVFGLTPALRATRVGLAEVMKDPAHGGGSRRSRLQGALIVAQIAVSLALITLANVFLRAAAPRRLEANEASRVAVVALDLDLLHLTEPAGRAWQQSLLARVGALPGVAAVASASFAPSAEPDPRRLRDVTGEGGREDYWDAAEVWGDWFGVAGEPIIAGRSLTPAELAGPPVVAVVDQVLARGMWGDSAAVGRVVRVGDSLTAAIVTVVGVMDTIRTGLFRSPGGRIIMPATAYSPRTYVHVRTTGPAQLMLDDLAAAVRTHDVRMPILWIRTAEQLARQDVAPIALVAKGLRALGATALALAALGLFGVMSFLVARRRREIAVRVALGARRHDVTGLVFRQAFRLGGAGVLLGGALATAAALGVRSVIYGVPALDPVALAWAAALMLVVAVVASVGPARRAAGVDPNSVLRDY